MTLKFTKGSWRQTALDNVLNNQKTGWKSKKSLFLDYYQIKCCHKVPWKTQKTLSMVNSCDNKKCVLDNIVKAFLWHQMVWTYSSFYSQGSTMGLKTHILFLKYFKILYISSKYQDVWHSFKCASSGKHSNCHPGPVVNKDALLLT